MGSAHLISVGQIEGGVLTRGFSDLHPELTQYTVLWNGTMAAEAQKADQRAALEVQEEITTRQAA